MTSSNEEVISSEDEFPIPKSKKRGAVISFEDETSMLKSKKRGNADILNEPNRNHGKKRVCKLT